MSQPIVLTGANIKIYINNKVYKTVQSITFEVSYEETPIFGVDANYPQEIAPGKITVNGSVQGLRLKLDGGLQGSNMRPLFTDAAAGPYISLRIQDRATQEDILYIPNAKISKERHAIVTKQVYKLNFYFVGQIPLFSLDRA